MSASDKFARLVREMVDRGVASALSKAGARHNATMRVHGDGSTWALLDGAEAETPVTLNMAARDGDRVVVEVRNHTATVVGNFSAPATDDATANAALERVEGIEADYVKAEVVEAAVGFFDELYAEEVTAEKLTAASAYVGDLEAGNVTAQSLTADVAKVHSLTADELSAATGYVGRLKADSITTGDIKAATGYISDLTADQITTGDIKAATGYIGDLEAENITTGNIKAATGYIDDLVSDSITSRDIWTATGFIGDLTSNNITAGDVRAATGYISDLTADQITAGDIQAATGYISQLEADQITAGDITAATGFVGSLAANDITAREIAADHATVGDLDATYATIETLEADYAHITDGVIDNAKIDYADIEDADIHFANVDMANVNNAWIESGTIRNAAITNEMVLGVSANKLTAGTIDASRINVANLSADNLVVRRINGQPVVGGYTLVSPTSPGYSSKNPKAQGWYELSNSQFVGTGDTSVVDGKAYYQEGDEVALYDQSYIDGIERSLSDRIDNAVETFTGADIPTLTNWPYTDWYDTSTTPVTDTRASHVGDIYYVVNPTGSEDGFCYRFYYDRTQQAYDWARIKDSDVTKALGDITDLQTFESETTSWIEETDEGLETIRTNHTTLSGVVDKTVKSSVQLWFTKANTTAPNPPTAKVTSTSTAGNAWRVVVPAWNASYPNYFYCWQYELVDGGYTWSTVVRDIAMGETQGVARDAKNTADAALPSATFVEFEQDTFKTLVDEVDEQSSTITQLSKRTETLANMLYDTDVDSLTKVNGPYNRYWVNAGAAYASHLACSIVELSDPPEPGIRYAARVTSDGGYSDGASEMGVVFYNNPTTDLTSVPLVTGQTYTFSMWVRCTEGAFSSVRAAYRKGGAQRNMGTVSASDMGGGWSRYVRTFTPQAYDTADDYQRIWTYARFAASQAGTVEMCGYRLVPGVGDDAVTTVSNTVNEVKQTATSNSSTISQLTRTLGTNEDGTTKAEDIVHRTSAIEQDLDGITTRVGKVESRTGVRLSLTRGNWTDAGWATYEAVGYTGSFANKHYDASGTGTNTGFDATTLVVGDIIVVEGTSSDTGTPHSVTCKVNSVPTSATGSINCTTVSAVNSMSTTTQVSELKITAEGLTTRVGKTEAYTESLANPNLTPWFSNTVDDTDYWYSLHVRNDTMSNTEGLHGLWDGEDGWAHVTLDARTSAGNDGSKTCYMNMHVRKGKISDRVTPGGKYTWMIEVKTRTLSLATGGRLCVAPSVNNATADVFSAVPTSVSYITAAGEYVRYAVVTAKSDFSVLTDNRDTRGYCYVTTGSYADFDVRISLYEGEYTGPYKPYVESTLLNRMLSAETSIEQNAEAISLNAKKTESASNMLYDADAPSLTKVNGPADRYVSNATGTHGSIAASIVELSDPPEAGLSHALRLTLATAQTATANRALTFYNHSANSIPFVVGQRYVASWWGRCTSGTGQTYICYSNGGASSYKAGTTYDLTSEWKQYTQDFEFLELSTSYNRIWFYGRFLTGETGTVELCGFKLVPATYATSAELKVANNEISSKVSSNGVISAINQTAETIKIQASKVAIDGTAVFNAIKSSTDAAYDAKGAASAVQTNLDNLQVGGRNLLLATATSKTSAASASASAYTGSWAQSAYLEAMDLVANETTLTYSFDWEVSGNSASGAFVYAQLFGVAPASAYCIRTSYEAHSGQNPCRQYLDGATSGHYELSFYVSQAQLDSANKNTNRVRIQDATDGAKVTVSNLKLETGNRATDWTPAPEDVSSEIDGVRTTANAAATKANAVKRTQRIYYRSSVNTKPATPGAWVTEAGNRWAANATTASNWTTKVTPIASGTGSDVTRYLYLWTCEQREMGDGDLEYTTVLLDDSTTVIDGGKLITGSVTANEIDATNLHVEAANIDGTITFGQVDGLQTALNGKQAAGSYATTSALTTEASQRKAKYGTCSTTAGTQAKEVTCSDFELVAGNELTVKFTTANTYCAGAVQLNVNGKGAKNVWVANAVTSTSNFLLWGANAYITFRYDGAQFVVIGEPRTWYGASTTAAGTAAKTDTTAVTGCVICRGAKVELAMTNDNTAAEPTLNVQSTGAKAIYFGGGTARPTKASGTSWLAANTATFTFDGTAWRTVGKTYIDANSIVTGYLSADRIEGGSLTIGKLDTSTQGKVNSAYADSVEYISGTHGTDATNAWTGTTRDSSLAAGKTIAFKMTSAGTSTAATLNLTLSGGGTTGAKALRRSNSTVTTQFPSGSVLMMTYDGTYWRITGLGSDTNYYDRTAYKASVTASDAIAAGRIAVFGTDGKLKLLAASAFDVTRPILYVGTAYTADALTQTNNYTFWGTAFTITNTHAVAGAAAGKPVYVVGTLSGTTFTPNSTVLTCTVPTSASALAYLRLGLMSTSTTAVLEADHPVYMYFDGKFQQCDPATTTAATRATSYITDVDSAGIKVHPSGSTTDYALINASGMEVFDGGTSVAAFGSTARIGTSSGARVAITSTPNIDMYDKDNLLAGRFNQRGLYIYGKVAGTNRQVAFFGNTTDADTGQPQAIIGYVASGHNNVVVDNTSFRVRANTTELMSVDSTGTLTVRKGTSTSDPWVKMTPFYNRTVNWIASASTQPYEAQYSGYDFTTGTGTSTSTDKVSIGEGRIDAVHGHIERFLSDLVRSDVVIADTVRTKALALPTGFMGEHEYADVVDQLVELTGINGAYADNVVWAGPASESEFGNGFRALVAADIPNLPAGKITSGTLPIARGGTGLATSSTANRVFATAASTPDSATAPSWRALVAADIPGLAASKITSGTLALARGGTAADNSARTPNTVFAGPSSGTATGNASWRALVAADIPNLAASKVTSGTLALARGGTASDNTARAINTVFAGPSSGDAGNASWRKLAAADIPSLAASKVTSGTFAADRIPALDTSKINGLGTSYEASKSVAISTAGIDTLTTGPSVKLPAGTYVIVARWTFNTGSSSGARNCQVSIGRATSALWATQRIYMGANNYCVVQCTDIRTLSEETTVYVYASSSMTYATASTQYINAVRIS